MILRTFNNPTNIFLIGDQVKYGKNYGLTDDFSELDLNIGEDYSNIETTGHFSILTEKELYNYIIDTDYLSKINKTYHFAIYDECGIIKFLITRTTNQYEWVGKYGYEIRSTDKLTHYLRVKCDEIISERDVESFRNGKDWINKWV
jgi:hypothetical protein